MGKPKVFELSSSFIDNCMEIANSQFCWYEEDEYQEYKNHLMFGW